MWQSTRYYQEFLRFYQGEKKVYCNLEKLCGRNNQPSYVLDPLSRLLDSKLMKSYSSQK